MPTYTVEIASDVTFTDKMYQSVFCAVIVFLGSRFPLPLWPYHLHHDTTSRSIEYAVEVAAVWFVISIVLAKIFNRQRYSLEFDGEKVWTRRWGIV